MDKSDKRWLRPNNEENERNVAGEFERPGDLPDKIIGLSSVLETTMGDSKHGGFPDRESQEAFEHAMAREDAKDARDTAVDAGATIYTVAPGEVSDGSTASYYELPALAEELQDLISYRNMNSQIGEIFRSCYRYGLSSHSSRLRDARKIRFYIEAEIERLENYE